MSWMEPFDEISTTGRTRVLKLSKSTFLLARRVWILSALKMLASIIEVVTVSKM